MATSVPRHRPPPHAGGAADTDADADTDAAAKAGLRPRLANPGPVLWPPLALLTLLALLTAACTAGDDPGPIQASGQLAEAARSGQAGDPADGGPPDGGPAAGESADGTAAPVTASTVAPSVSDSPDWLGGRPLPTTPDGRVVVPQTTPEELRDRRLATVDTLAPPPDDAFAATVGPVPPDVLARSTWVPGCPVEPEGLSYLTLTFWGFDGQPHTGEMIVNAEVADDIVSVFRRLHEARFPIEEMRVVQRAELDADPTGDGNVTGSFVCRAVTGGRTYSEHAYGLAIDINPFHNPYQRHELILPELAGHYLDRSLDQPGMILPDDVVVRAFADIGWSWGGDWNSLKDYQHFSHNGR